MYFPNVSVITDVFCLSGDTLDQLTIGLRFGPQSWQE
jgi:hypothetical protein